MNKFLFPIVFIGEWVLFFGVSLLLIIFNIVHLANMIYVDMPWEEPVLLVSSTTMFIQFVLLVLGLSIVCFSYIKYFAGVGLYKKFKASAWGILFSICLISSLGYLLAWYRNNVIHSLDLILLIFVILVSLFFTLYIIKRFK